jgi:hypothetical protein
MSQDEGTAMIVFDAEEPAQAVANVARSAPSAGVTAGDVQVGKVMAHA